MDKILETPPSLLEYNSAGSQTTAYIMTIKLSQRLSKGHFNKNDDYKVHKGSLYISQLLYWAALVSARCNK